MSSRKTDNEKPDLERTRQGFSESENLSITEPSESPPSHSSSTPPREPKYIFIGFFIHGGYHKKSTNPYRENPHASRSLMTFHSTPKLMTFTNSSPGNIVLGDADGRDNTKLVNYFKTNSNINLLTDTNQDQDKIIAEKFLNYSKDALATLPTNPRDDLEDYKNNLRKPKKMEEASVSSSGVSSSVMGSKKMEEAKKMEEKYISRNSFISNNKVGISHTFINKSFSTDDPSSDEANMSSWGVLIFNNNCDIEPGTRIEELLPDMPQEYITNENGEDIGIRISLYNIITHLERNYHLTDEDYLFFFDYTCSTFTEETNPRVKRSWGRQITKDSGFGKRSKMKRSKMKRSKMKRSQKRPNKRSQKNGQR